MISDDQPSAFSSSVVEPNNLLLPSLDDATSGRRKSSTTMKTTVSDVYRRKSRTGPSSIPPDQRREEQRRRDRAKFIDETPIFEGDMAPDFIALDSEASANLMPHIGSSAGERRSSLTSKLLSGSTAVTQASNSSSTSGKKKTLNFLDTSLPKTAIVTLGRSFNDSRRVKFGHSYRITRKLDVDEDRAISGLQFDPSQWMELKRQVDLERSIIPSIYKSGSNSSGELGHEVNNSSLSMSSRLSMNSNAEVNEDGDLYSRRKSISASKKDGLLAATIKTSAGPGTDANGAKKTKQYLSSINAVTPINSGWRTDYPPTLGSDAASKWEKKKFQVQSKNRPTTAAAATKPDSDPNANPTGNI